MVTLDTQLGADYMALINLSGPYKQAYNILRTLLHEGTPVGLRFFGPTSNAVGGIQEIVTVTDGWWHKKSKDPETGTIIETVKISESPTMTEEVLKKALGFDIVYDDNTFVRYNFNAKSQKKPLSKAWVLTVTPSKGDKRELYVPGP